MNKFEENRMIAIENLKINHAKEAIGVEFPLFLSWNLVCDERACVQKYWKVTISETEDFSSIVFECSQLSSLSAEVALLFDTAKSFTKYYVKLEVKTSSEKLVEATSFFVTGQLSKENWKGCFITGDESVSNDICLVNQNSEKHAERDNNKKDIDYKHSAAHFLQKDFVLHEDIKSAYAAVSALGLYELYINENRVGKDFFTPGWTSYDYRVQYQLYDVTDLLLNSNNVIKIHVGTGWYKGELAFYADCNVYGNRTAAFLNLVIEYKNGKKEIIASDESWFYKKSPLIFTEIYHGEIYDARLESEENLKKVEKVDFNLAKLVSQPSCRIKAHERFPALSIIKTPKGETVIDFGQNLSGFVEFKIKAEKGTELSFRCFEELDCNGNVYAKNLRRAQQR
ncbi:MAG: family 78 glycoside hydrolase catalytic domain, partial [Treponema sp.]|nr:family 78 glycoside hydrolase catalytic domain [Treponema sp.]